MLTGFQTSFSFRHPSAIYRWSSAVAAEGVLM
jgi:hypothetical protein